MRLPVLRSVLFVALVAAVLPGVTRVVRADDPTGSCAGSAHADAASYDGSRSGSADNNVSAPDGYSVDDCVGLGRTNAVFTAGTACGNAGIAPGVEYGLGYAVVTWSTVWQNTESGEVTVVGPIRQQYDCGDTFS